MRCKDCVDDKVASPAAYCSKECQRRSWEEHKSWHQDQRLNLYCDEHAKAALNFALRLAAAGVEEAGAATEPGRLLFRGCELLFLTDLKGAAKCCQKVIQLQPASALRADAHSLLGQVWSASHDYLQAAQSFLAAMEQYPVGSSDWGESAMHAWTARSRATTCKDMHCSCERCFEVNRKIPSPDWLRTPAAATLAVEQMLRACPKLSGPRLIAVKVHLQNKERWGAFQAALLAIWQLVVAPWYVPALMVVSVLGIMMFG